MKDINEVARSSEIHKLAKRPPAGTVAPESCKTAAVPDTAAFDERERELLKNSPQEDLAGLANLKKVFPGCTIRAVEPSPAEEPVSEAERKAQEADAHLKDICRRRNLVFADIERLWPAIEKRRRQQQREERKRKQ
ncbi:MAG TPA: hypothetical protein PLL10_06690 [Elusimicrobiales bacterium]|nr:hypothetical protein [Elusimicrobiales bacterium]